MWKSLAAALMCAPVVAWSHDPALEMQLRQLDAMHVMQLAANLSGRNLVAVWPAQDHVMDVSHRSITIPDLRQLAANRLGMKVVQRGGIELALPACQRPVFAASLVPPDNQRLTFNFARLMPAVAFALLADAGGLQFRLDVPLPDVDLAIRVENETPSEMLIAIAAALDVEPRIVGKTLEIHQRPPDPACGATAFRWVTDSKQFTRAKSAEQSPRFSNDCGRVARFPQSAADYPCTYFESAPLSRFTFHGYIKLSAHGRTMSIILPPGQSPIYRTSGTRLSEDFVSITDVDPDAVHLTRYDWRQGKAIASHFYRVPTQTGIPVDEAPEQVALSPPDEVYPGEFYALDEYVLESTTVAAGKSVARLRNPNGAVFSMRPGNSLGLNDGRIVAIDAKGVDLVEIISDGLGGYRERPVRMLVGVPFEYPRDVIRRTHALPVNETPAQMKFIEAALDGDVELLRARLVNGVQIDAHAGKIPRNALMAATAAGNLGAVKWLLSQGARPDLLVGPKENTALGMAAFAGDFATVRALVAAGADVNLADAKERSPLHEAASEGHVEIVELLLAKGADPRSLTSIGLTPFTAAAAHGRVNCLEKLIAAGIKLEERDRNGYTMLGAAEENGAQEAARWLIAHGAKRSDRKAE